MRRAPRCQLINGKAGDEVVDATANRICRNACHPRPGGTVAGGAHHNIISATTALKTAIRPDHINFSGSINFSGGQGTGTKASSHGVAADRCYCNRAAPTRATISRVESQNARFVGIVDMDNDSTIRLNDRLST